MLLTKERGRKRKRGGGEQRPSRRSLYRLSLIAQVLAKQSMKTSEQSDLNKLKPGACRPCNRREALYAGLGFA